MQGFLVQSNGERTAVRDGLVIGRVTGCDLVIEDAKASRRHARLIVEGSVVEIEDLGSSNGTLLNGKPVTRRVLRAGDEIQIGTTVLRCEVAGAAAPAVPQGGRPPDDDVDLFGSESAGPSPAAALPAPPPPPRVAPPPVAPAPPPPPRVAPPPVAPPPPPRAAQPAPPAAPPKPPSQVVEFEDEVVVVEKAVPAPGRAPAPTGGGPIEQQSRLLQYAKKADRGGPLGDDLAQMGSGQRYAMYFLVLAVGAGLFYLAMQLAG